VGRYLLFMVVIPVAVATWTQGIRGRQDSLTPPEIIEVESRAGISHDEARVDHLMMPWLDSRLTDLDAHRAFVDLSLDTRSKRSRARWGQPGDPLWAYYEELAKPHVAGVRDAGLWGLAYCELRRDSVQRSLALLDRISNPRLHGVQLMRGLALYGLREYARGDSALRAAIEDEDVRLATKTLSMIMLYRQDWAALQHLRRDPRTGPFVPGTARRALDLHSGAFFLYLGDLLAAQRMPLVPALLLLALYTGCVWFFLIRWWDAFEKEPWSTSLLAVVLGGISTMGVDVVHDVLNLVGPVDTTGIAVVDFLYFVFVVGLVEESVKIAPVFLLGRFGAKEMNEPADWMIYGCLSALGFSLVENYEYLVNYGLQVGIGRFFLSTPAHLSYTGALALTLRRIFQRGPHAWRRFAGALIGVALLHGTFDFLLDFKRVGTSILAIVVGPLWGLVFLRALSRVVSQSPYRKNPAAYRMSCTSWFMGAFALLCVVKYIAVARVLGAAEALPELVWELVGGPGVPVGGLDLLATGYCTSGRRPGPKLGFVPGDRSGAGG
jgi:RsiW-degrading membrane proteinase PrsW (M82 family)